MFHLQCKEPAIPEGHGATDVRVPQCPVVSPALPTQVCQPRSGLGPWRSGLCPVCVRLSGHPGSDRRGASHVCVPLFHRLYAKGVWNVMLYITLFPVAVE